MGEKDLSIKDKKPTNKKTTTKIPVDETHIQNS